ncbi:hypothetical protein [Mangrovimicrobium sediminis]|uniref:hypothetical protein n=1 Tax=Mangrovimicrobium sediminis TaxID=2562682 RepID=UPI001436C7B5|nr:hypothetical protein [Haliea sp. SAOS-164]
MSATGAWGAAIQQQILDNNGSGIGTGGDSVAVAGEWALVGDTDNCRVYVYRLDQTTKLWGDGGKNTGTVQPGVPHSQLNPRNSCSAAEYGGFGNAVSISRDLLVVGAPLAKTGGPVRYGIVYLFSYDSGSDEWVIDPGIGEPVAFSGPGTIVDDRQAGAGFGTQVSVRYSELADEALILAGAPFYDGPNGVNAGRAYAYLWDGATSTVELIGTYDGDATGDRFGSSITSNGVRILAGAPNADVVLPDTTVAIDSGRAYLFSFDRANFPALALDQIVPGTAEPMSGLVVPGMNLAREASLSIDGVMLLSGNTNFSGAQVLYRGGGTCGADEYCHDATLPGTLSGDVTQSGVSAAFGYSARSVQVYTNNRTIGADRISPGPAYQVAPPGGLESRFGQDISLSGQWLEVNGDATDRAYMFGAVCAGDVQLTAMEWTMIGLPCDIGSGSATIDDIFTPSLGVYGTDWIMYQQDGVDFGGQSSVYEVMSDTDTMTQGVGYWIISAVDAVVDFGLSVGTKAATPSVSDPLARLSVTEVFSLDLKGLLSGWSAPSTDLRVMLSNPFPQPVNWGETIINDGTALNTVASVPVQTLFFEGGDNQAYVYNAASGGYTAISTDTPGMPRQINSGEGYFVRFSGTGATLVQSAPTSLLQTSVSN